MIASVWPALRDGYVEHVAEAARKKTPYRDTHEPLFEDWLNTSNGPNFRVYDPDLVGPHERRHRDVVVRDDQAGLRKEILERWDGVCPISGCDVHAALEAAHLLSHAEYGDASQYAENVLPLRADLHRLFDRNWLGIDPESSSIWLAPELRCGSYGEFHGRIIDTQKLDPRALARRWAQTQSAHLERVGSSD
jgi:hypothetical protein